MLTARQIEAIKLRSQVQKTIREFFEKRGYLEVDTPLLSPDLIPEPSISAFTAKFHNEFRGDRDLYLIPSPEVYMKKLLAWGSGSIFQINRCFRNEEQLGRLHNPEFTMLEWYTVDADYMDSLQTSVGLLEALASYDSQGICSREAVIMTVSHACRTYAGVDIESLQDLDDLTAAAASLGLSMPQERNDTTWEEVFNRIFLTFVEPELPKDRPCFLTDYPRQIACLAKDIPGTPWKERWELYLGGWELANCFSEEIAYEKAVSYYEDAVVELSALSALTGRRAPRTDYSFPELYRRKHPPCSGTALGVDRLLMALSGAKDIQGVILFPLSDIL